MKDAFASIIGQHGFNNRNAKGTRTLQTLTSMNIRVLNTFFRKSNYTTWRCPRSRHHFMLDIFTSSIQLSHQIHDFRVVNFGVESDHSATCIDLFLNSIAFKDKRQYQVYKGVPDWNEIQYNKETNKSTMTELISSMATTTQRTTAFFAPTSYAQQKTQQRNYPTRTKDGLTSVDLT